MSEEYIKNLEKRNEELQQKLYLLTDEFDEYINKTEGIIQNKNILLDEYIKITNRYKADYDRYKTDYESTCKLVADMHAAAIGEIRGPIKGVVEDIIDLKAKYDKLVIERTSIMTDCIISLEKETKN